jgi:predicted tellurium resistance membrane protein TerC
VAAVRLLRPPNTEDETKPPAWMTWLTKWQPVSANCDHFFVEENGRRMVTVLLLALVAVELTDVVFALDSIPAVLSITRVPFLAYTSNILAVMGLRSLYVLLAASLAKLRYSALRAGRGAAVCRDEDAAGGLGRDWAAGVAGGDCGAARGDGGGVVGGGAVS